MTGVGDGRRGRGRRVRVSARLSVRARRPTVAVGLAAAVILVAGLSACGGSATGRAPSPPRRGAGAARLPGTGKPLVTIGDKNFTEQFILGELYAQALSEKGYSVVVNRNIGPTEVTAQALLSGRLSMYPEYLETWNRAVAGLPDAFRSMPAALRAGRRWGRAHGLQLLAPTPFSSTAAVALTRPYAAAHRLRTLADLRRVAAALSIGAAPQVAHSATGLPGIEQAYGFVPASFTALAIGGQYEALDQGRIEAAVVSTTDGQLVSGRYRLLDDPMHVFGWGQVVPVVPRRVLEAEGPAFAAAINRVSALLTQPVIRRLNAQVDVENQDPAAVARQFLARHGLLRPGAS